jgi:cation-dependent mannose-6-phosphate receptor
MKAVNSISNGVVMSLVLPTESRNSRLGITLLLGPCKLFHSKQKQKWKLIYRLFIAILTWFLGHTLYNRFFLQRRGKDILPLPNFSKFKLPSLPSRSSSTGQSGPKWGSWRRSARSGYSGIRAEEGDEHEGFAGRFSLDDDDEDLDDGPDEILGEDRDAWRDIPGRTDTSGTGAGGGNGKGKGRVGVHQGLTDV